MSEEGYLDQVIELGSRLQAGMIGEVDVSHDDKGPTWRGQPCNCRPVVKLRRVRRKVRHG